MLLRVSMASKHSTAGETKYPVSNPVGAITNLVVAHYIQQRDDVGPARQILQDLDFSLYLLLLDGLEDFDDAFLVVDDIDALEDLRVFSAPNLADHFVVLQDAPRDVDRVVVPVGAGHVRIDVGIDAGNARRAGGIVQRHAGRKSVLGRRRRASDSSGRREVSGCGGRVEWWGEEAEVSGTQQEARKASKHAERNCLVPRKAPGESWAKLATRAQCCNYGLDLAGGRRRCFDAERELRLRVVVVQAACGCLLLATHVTEHKALDATQTLVIVLTHLFWCPAFEARPTALLSLQS